MRTNEQSFGRTGKNEKTKQKQGKTCTSTNRFKSLNQVSVSIL